MELIEVILSKENLNRAYKKVVANKGAGGVDGVTVEELGNYIRENREKIITSLRNRKNIRTGKKILQGHTSYGMKHLLEHDTGVYLTNNEFKDAMLLAGYRPVNPNSLNWKYRIELTREINDNPSPFFRWAGNFEADASPCGDFVRDMLHDFEFPVLAEHDVIARYLGRIGACSGAVEAFEMLWREYEGTAD